MTATDVELRRLFDRVLELIGEDPTRPGLVETPHRMARALLEMTNGYGVDPATVVKLFEREGADLNEIVIIRDVPFTSLCEHHVLPFTGTVTVAYIPGQSIIGLSKVPRLVNVFARRLQVQERLTSQIADAFMEHVQPLGVMVVIKAEHACMSMRGVSVQGSTTITSALRGVFMFNPEAKREALTLLGQ